MLSTYNTTLNERQTNLTFKTDAGMCLIIQPAVIDTQQAVYAVFYRRGTGTKRPRGIVNEKY